jgi:DNA-binding response OmpR family regulator
MFYTFADCALDLQRVTLRRGSETMQLRPKVLQVLIYLIEHRQRVVSKQELCEAVWPDQFISDATLESTVRAVRRTVGDDRNTQQIIRTLIGHGYRFVATVTETPGQPVTVADPVLETTPLAPAPAPDPQQPGTSPATILVVDDESLVIKRLQAVLLPRGYRVLSAANGAEALQHVQQEPPDLVLLDVMMPMMDGFETCRRLKNAPETRLIPVVLMTALGELQDRIKGLEAGADDFLTKPVHRDELLARIRTSLRLKHTIEQTVEARRQARGQMHRSPLYLTLTRQGDTMTVDLAAPDPLVAQEHTDIAASLVTEIGDELARLTMAAKTSETAETTAESAARDTSDATPVALQRLGSVIFSHLLPPATRQRLSQNAATDLFLRLDAGLVHIPWELAFDGQAFWQTKFCLGRQVINASSTSGTRPPHAPATDRMRLLIIADPTERWPAIRQEAEHLTELLRACPNLEVTVVGGKGLRKIDVLLALPDQELVHYLGDMACDVRQPSRSGWLLQDGLLSAAEFGHVTRVPLVVFVNACQPQPARQAAVVYEAQAANVGSGFSLAGAPHYIAPFYVVHSTDSAAFAADFYRDFLAGASVGAALVHARQQAQHTRTEHNMCWASYMHYGNPTFRLPTPSVER